MDDLMANAATMEATGARVHDPSLTNHAASGSMPIAARCAFASGFETP